MKLRLKIDKLKVDATFKVVYIKRAFLSYRHKRKHHLPNKTYLYKFRFIHYENSRQEI